MCCRQFPWIAEVFDVSAYHFYKVVELIVREEEGLTRDVVKHLNHVSDCLYLPLLILAYRGYLKHVCSLHNS